MTNTQDPEPGRTLLCPRCEADTFHALLRDTPNTKVYICERCKYRRVFRKPGVKDALPEASDILTDKMMMKEVRIRRALDELMTEAVNNFFQDPQAFVDAIPLLESAMNGGPAGPALDTMSSKVVYKFAWLTALRIWMDGLERWRFVRKHMKDEGEKE